MSETLAPASPAGTSDTSVASAFDSFVAETPKTDAPAPSSETPASPAPAPAPATPAAETPPRRAVKVKLDHEEKEIDESWLSDEEKSKDLREKYQKGYAYDRAVARTAQEKFAEGQRAVAQSLIERGFTFKPKVANPQTLADYEVIPPAVTTPQKVDQAQTTADPELDALTKREKELVPKVRQGDAEAAEELTSVRADLAALRHTKALEAKFKAQEQEMTRKAQEAQRETEKKSYESNVDAALIEAINARTKSFEGVEDKVANDVRSIVWTLAREATIRNNGDVETAKQNAAVLMNSIEGYVASRIKHLTATATPTAPQVIGGSPASAKSTATNKTPSIHDNDWMDAALEEASKPRLVR